MADFYELKSIFAKFSTADRDADLRGLAENMRIMQLRWPRKVDFSGLLPNSEIAIFPLFFAPAFGPIDGARLQRFLTGCYLVAGAIMSADAMFDEQLERDDQIAYLLRWHGIEFELARELAGIFPPHSPFWPAMQGALAEYLGCVASEWTYASRSRRLADVTHDECVELALAKSSVSRIAIVGLSLLGDDASRTPALLKSLDHYNLARQIWDDVADWKADLRANLPTLVTARLAAALGLETTQPEALDMRALTRELHYGGHLAELLSLARTSLARALDAADRERRLPWHTLLESFERLVTTLQCDLDEIAQRAAQRRSRSAVSA